MDMPQFANFNLQPQYLGNLQSSFPGQFVNQHELNFQVRGQAQKLNHVRPNKTNQAFYQQHIPVNQPANIRLQAPNVPTLNEILAQLHQDPGFRQRYKEYCRAVLDGRFMGNIKNPIHPMFESNKKAQQQHQSTQDNVQPQFKNAFFEQISYKKYDGQEDKQVHPYMLSKTYQVMSMQQQQQQNQSGSGVPQGKLPQTLMINHNQLNYLENNKIPHSVTLLSNNNRQNQIKQAVGSNSKYGSVNPQSSGNSTNNVNSKVSIPMTNNKQHSHQQQRRQNMPQKMDTISHQPVQNNPTISEAAYFIQRVNRILQTQGHNNSNQSSHDKGNHGSYSNQNQTASTTGIEKNNLQSSQIYTSSSQMKQYQGNLPPNAQKPSSGKNNGNPYMIIGSSENSQTQCAIRSLSYNNKGVLEVGADSAIVMKLNSGGGGKREREVINRHEHRYGSTTNHTGLLNLPRTQKNNINNTYLQEALKMKEQRTLQIQQKSQNNLVQFMPAQYPTSPGMHSNQNHDHANEYLPMGNQQHQHNLIMQQQKQMIDSLKSNFNNKQPGSSSGMNKQFTERNTMNATQNIPNQESFNKNKVMIPNNQNANYGVTVYSRSQMAQKIEQTATHSQSLITKHNPKRPSNQFQPKNLGFNDQDFTQLTPNTNKASFIVKK